LALFERDEDVEQIRAAEIEEERIEREMSDEIIALRKSKIEFKVILVLVILFLIAGYFWKVMQSND
jgi:hypothetical protein